MNTRLGTMDRHRAPFAACCLHLRHLTAPDEWTICRDQDGRWHHVSFCGWIVEAPAPETCACGHHMNEHHLAHGGCIRWLAHGRRHCAAYRPRGSIADGAYFYELARFCLHLVRLARTDLFYRGGQAEEEAARWLRRAHACRDRARAAAATPVGVTP